MNLTYVFVGSKATSPTLVVVGIFVKGRLGQGRATVAVIRIAIGWCGSKLSSKDGDVLEKGFSEFRPPTATVLVVVAVGSAVIGVLV